MEILVITCPWYVFFQIQKKKIVNWKIEKFDKQIRKLRLPKYFLYAQQWVPQEFRTQTVKQLYLAFRHSNARQPDPQETVYQAHSSLREKGPEKGFILS